MTQQVAGFLRRELPIRLAHRIIDLNQAPQMQDMPSVATVRDLYVTSFLELLSVDKNIKNLGEEEKLASLLEGIYERHAGVLVQMARGAFELRAAIRSGSGSGNDGVDFDKMNDVHEFLDRFYISRIGIRVLIGQYLSLRQPPVENYVGIICSRTSPYEVSAVFGPLDWVSSWNTNEERCTIRKNVSAYFSLRLIPL